jgi:hypothetical protein
VLRDHGDEVFQHLRLPDAGWSPACRPSVWMRWLLPFGNAPWGAQCANVTAVGDSQTLRKCAAARPAHLT